jgi:phage terminase Nu1 subunit (DNA packaging protein)
MAEVIHRYVPAPKIKPKISPAEERERADRRKADAELTAERSKGVRAKRLQSELFLAKARGELIPKTLVQTQASFLVVAIRSRICQLPATYSRRILNISDVEVARAILTKAAHELLAELQDLPKKVTDPDFLSRLDREEDDGGKV